MNTQSKRNQRKEKKENEQNQPTRLQEALQQIAELKEQLRALEGKYNEKRVADAKNRVRVQELEAKLEKSKEKEESLSRQLEKVMEARAVPIVSAVVMKAMYKKAAGIPEQVKPADGQAQPADGQAQPADKQDGRVEKIRGLERQFLNHGYDNAQQVTEFADLVSSSFLSCCTREQDSPLPPPTQPEPPSAPPVITPAGTKRVVKTVSAINCPSTLESSDTAISLLRVVWGRVAAISAGRNSLAVAAWVVLAL
ncbi:hypothetical protein HOY82DRAFT_538536 [Tuber indicum]|nr:hypothetical protein HOY82DRAFT_538536 [Tuber indicum]